MEDNPIMRIYKENIPSLKMMECSSAYCRQSRQGLLCWTFTKDAELFPSHPSPVWFDNTAWKEPVIISNTDEWVSTWMTLYGDGGNYTHTMLDRLQRVTEKEPLISSNIDEWASTWDRLYDNHDRHSCTIFNRLQKLGNDIDKLYWDEEFGRSGSLTHLLSILPRPIEEHLLMDIVEDLAKRYNLNLNKSYWFNQRHTIHFWIHQRGLMTFIASLQYQIGLDKIEESNKIIRRWIPSISSYMDNRQFWEEFFKPNLNR